jgi:hypothetical protein
MNLRGKLVLTAAVFVLTAGLAGLGQTAYTFDWRAFDRACSLPEGEVGTAADGFGIVRDLAKLALSAPSGTAQIAQFDYIICLLEGSSGPDSSIAGIPTNVVFVDPRWLLFGRHIPSSLFAQPFPRLFEWSSAPGWQIPASTLYVVEGGAVGATENAGTLVENLAAFIRENEAPLVAYYAATYGMDGSIVVEARLAAIRILQSDVETLARHALSAALDATTSSDPQIRREKLLILYADCAAIGGMDPTPESSDRDSFGSTTVGEGWSNLVSLAGDLYRALGQLQTDMTDALAATVTP